MERSHWIDEPGNFRHFTVNQGTSHRHRALHASDGYTHVVQYFPDADLTFRGLLLLVAQYFTFRIVSAILSVAMIQVSTCP